MRPDLAGSGPRTNGDRAPQTLDVPEPGIIVLQGLPVSGKASLFFQALPSAANKGLAVGYISGAHPSFVTRQLEAMLTYLGLTSKNPYLFPDAPREAIEASVSRTSSRTAISISLHRRLSRPPRHQSRGADRRDHLP